MQKKHNSQAQLSNATPYSTLNKYKLAICNFETILRSRLPNVNKKVSSNTCRELAHINCSPYLQTKSLLVTITITCSFITHASFTQSSCSNSTPNRPKMYCTTPNDIYPLTSATSSTYTKTTKKKQQKQNNDYYLKIV